MKNILCVRLDNVGDVLMTTPAFRSLKQTWPDAKLTLLTSSAGAAIATLLPDIDAVIPFAVPWVQGSGGLSSAVLDMAQRLQHDQFDLAVLFTVQSQSPLPAAMLCYLANVPRVLGYCRENPYQLMTNWIPDPEILVATRHEVERQLALLEALGCQRPADCRLSLCVPDSDRDMARWLLTARGIDPTRPWLVLHPGVSEEKRRYPADCFAEVAQTLIRQHGYQLVLTGSTMERALTDSIAQQLTGNVVNLAGELSLGTLGGLLTEAPVLLANNTGPVHMAAALQTPVVVVYAKTNPQHTPWQVPHRVLYIDVPVQLRSRNALLQQFPEVNEPMATPASLVEAVLAVTRHQPITASSFVTGAVESQRETLPATGA